MIPLLILCLTSTLVSAVSNPEIATKSGKSPLSPSSVQQQSTQKATSQHSEPLLNSINAYAQQYESVTPPKPYGITTQLYSQQYIPASANYKLSNLPQLPSSPTIEHNFQPMPSPHHQHAPHIQTQQSPPTPVIMQYVPQSQINDGVQYLQLIPTRPLIVPISPYMSPMAHAYQQSPQIITPQVNDYPGRSEPDPSSSIPYGLQSYANNLQNYRTYRFNRDINPSNMPTGLALNTNEYMPSPNDAPKPAMMIRGRP